jgi:hypothetical protein
MAEGVGEWLRVSEIAQGWWQLAEGGGDWLRVVAIGLRWQRRVKAASKPQ